MAMNETPEVSVIIPAFNSSNTVEEALESVRLQSYSDLEIIVVDDASNDTTVEYAEKWCRESSITCRVVVQDRNVGPAAARNRGLREAHGEWIAFLDADDAWLPHRLALQLKLAAIHPDVALWCGETIAFGNRSQESGVRSQEPGFKLLSLDTFVEGNPVATSTVLVRRSALLAVGGFDEQFRGPEDYDLWMRLAARFPLAMIAAELSAYRYVTGSLSMDDRRFLPQVLSVLSKAFAAGGVFADRRELRRTSLAAQYWHAAWMAFCCGARGRALRHWSRAFTASCSSRRRRARPWLRLLIRYLFGRPPAVASTQRI